MTSIWKAASCAILLSAAIVPALAQPAAAPAPGAAPRAPFILTSTSFEDGGVIPDKYSAANKAGAISPALSWSSVPAGTVTYALIMHDPDNAQQKHIQDTLHWMMFNIPGTLTSLPEGIPNKPQLPDGSIQAMTNVPGFMGPGARGNYHHYTIELFALDTKLSLGPDATRDQVIAAIDGHILRKAVIVGRFHL
jgi:Raf kinase inhibitor-like YbhB/YbcL family protein